MWPCGKETETAASSHLSGLTPPPPPLRTVTRRQTLTPVTVLSVDSSSSVSLPSSGFEHLVYEHNNTAI